MVKQAAVYPAPPMTLGTSLIDRDSGRHLALGLMRSIFSALVRLYLVVAVLGGTWAGTGRTVLCVEPSGRMVLESAQGRCADRMPSASGDIADTDVATLPDGCGDCVDLPIGTNVLSASPHGPARANSLPSVSAPAGLSPAALRGPDVSVRAAVAFVARTLPAGSPSRTAILRN